MPFRRHRCVFVLLCAVPFALAAGCTSAKLGEAESTPDGGVNSRTDGGPILPPVDAEPPPGNADAGRVRLTQSTSLVVIGENSVACPESINSYYRVFDLGAAGIDGAIDIESVTFGLEEVVSGAGGIDATLVLHRLNGDFLLENLSTISTAQTVIPDVAGVDPGEVGGALHQVPIAARIEAGSVFVVELTHLALEAGQILLVGSNQAPQDAPTYLRAAECLEDQPLDADTIEVDGDPIVMHWVLVVEGRPAD